MNEVLSFHENFSLKIWRFTMNLKIERTFLFAKNTILNDNEAEWAHLTLLKSEFQEHFWIFMERWLLIRKFVVVSIWVCAKVLVIAWFFRNFTNYRTLIRCISPILTNTYNRAIVRLSSHTHPLTTRKTKFLITFLYHFFGSEKTFSVSNSSLREVHESRVELQWIFSVAHEKL